MTPQEFLAVVLPSSGVYCTAELSTPKKQHLYVDTIDTLVERACEFDSLHHNTYFALASFKEKGKRIVDNVYKIRSIFIDIDCGPEVGKNYPSKKEAVEALTKFLNDSQLDTLGSPYILSSGGGLHVYFPLTKDEDVDAWKPVAENFKRLCKKLGLNIDNTVTADAARVLRVPETHNYKKDKPRKVEIKVVGNTFELDKINDLLKEQLAGEHVSTISGKRLALPQGTSGVKLMENSITLFKNIKSCKQIDYYKEHAHEEGMEPLWRALLSITQKCGDGLEYARELSALHPYDEERMQQKLSQIKGPYSCVKFDSENPGVCSTCPNYKKITNPLILGRETLTDNTEKVIELTKEIEQPVSRAVETVTRPVPPRGFSYGSKGGIYKDIILEDSQGNKDTKQVPILSYDLFAVDILNNNGDHIVHMIATRPEGTVDVTFPQKAIISKDETLKHLASQNIVAVGGADSDKNFFYYVKGCVEEASIRRKAIKIPDSYGWQEDKSFVVNGTIYQPDGRKVNVPMPGLENLKMGTYAKGNIENWKKFVNTLVARESYELLTLGLVGLGSVLMHFTKYHGLTFHARSSTSGSGKSLSLVLAASFWGHPVSYRVSKDTSAVAMQQRQGLLHSLPLISDEITQKAREKFEDWVPSWLLDMTEGKGKERMEAGANKERLNLSTWKQMALLSSNAGFVDMLTGTRKHSSQGELYRLIEHTMDTTLEWTEEENKNIDYVDENYGIAGKMFIEWAVRNQDIVENIVEECRLMFKAKYTMAGDERFWLAGCSCVIASVVLLSSKYSNVIDLPVNAVIETLGKMVEKSRAAVRGSRRTAEDILNSFTRDNFGKFVVVKSVNGILDATLGQAGIIDQSLTRTSVLGRVEHDVTPGHVNYIIEAQVMQAHCASMGFGYSEFKTAMEAMPNYKITYGKYDLLAKTRGPTMRVNAMKICRPTYLEAELDET